MKISFIVPTYNRDQYIKKCIESVLKQTYKNVELIIVDDGSTDNTENIVTSYKDKKIKYFKNTNHGIGYSRNFGLEKSTGDYVFFLDSDDFIEPNAAESIIQNINDADIFIFDYKQIFESDGHVEYVRTPIFSECTLKEKPEIINQTNLGPGNKVFKKELLVKNNIKYPTDIKYEDMPLIIESLKKAHKIISSGFVLSNCVVHKGNETTTVDERVFDIFKVLDKVKNTLADKEYQDELNKLIVRKITTYTVSQRTQKDKKLIDKFIDEAFIYLKNNVSDYKNNKYYINRSFIKKIIERNKILTKLYCKIYRIFK